MALIYLTDISEIVISSGDRRSVSRTEDVVEKSRPSSPLPSRSEAFSPSCAQYTCRLTRLQGQSPVENFLNRHGGAIAVGISPLALSPLRQAQGPSWSVEMTGISSSGEPTFSWHPVNVTLSVFQRRH